jgi:hypothetical protein
MRAGGVFSLMSIAAGRRNAVPYRVEMNVPVGVAVPATRRFHTILTGWNLSFRRGFFIISPSFTKYSLYIYIYAKLFRK